MPNRHTTPTDPLPASPATRIPDGSVMPERVLHILTEAAALFAERGYERTSMRDLAERCGVSKSLLYHHFANKEEIYARIALGFMRELQEFVVARIPAEGTARDRVAAFMAASGIFFERYRLVWMVSANEFWTDPLLRHSSERLGRRHEFEGLLRSLLEAGVHSGELTASDVPLAGRLVLSALNWLPRWYDPGGRLDAVTILADYHRMIFDGLSARR